MSTISGLLGRDFAGYCLEPFFDSFALSTKSLMMLSSSFISPNAFSYMLLRIAIFDYETYRAGTIR